MMLINDRVIKPKVNLNLSQNYIINYLFKFSFKLFQY